MRSRAVRACVLGSHSHFLFRAASAQQLERPVAMALEDPSVYSEPRTIEMPLYLMVDDGAQLLEHKCVPFAEQLM